MISFPPEYTATRYPGYFWNIQNRQLYSIKVGGVLHPVAFQKANRFNKGHPGYRVSVGGKKKYMRQDILEKLVPVNSVIPVRK